MDTIWLSFQWNGQLVAFDEFDGWVATDSDVAEHFEERYPDPDRYYPTEIEALWSRIQEDHQSDVLVFVKMTPVPVLADPRLVQ